MSLLGISFAIAGISWVANQIATTKKDIAAQDRGYRLAEKYKRQAGKLETQGEQQVNDIRRDVTSGIADTTSAYAASGGRVRSGDAAIGTGDVDISGLADNPGTDRRRLDELSLPDLEDDPTYRQSTQSGSLMHLQNTALTRAERDINRTVQATRDAMATRYQDAWSAVKDGENAVTGFDYLANTINFASEATQTYSYWNSLQPDAK